MSIDGKVVFCNNVLPNVTGLVSLVRVTQSHPSSTSFVNRRESIKICFFVVLNSPSYLSLTKLDTESQFFILSLQVPLLVCLGILCRVLDSILQLLPGIRYVFTFSQPAQTCGTVAAMDTKDEVTHIAYLSTTVLLALSLSLCNWIFFVRTSLIA